MSAYDIVGFSKLGKDMVGVGKNRSEKGRTRIG